MREEGISAFFFFFNDTATTEIYTLSLHDALPISVIAAVVGVYFGIKHRARRMLDEIVLDLAPLEARLRREIENAEQKEAPPASTRTFRISHGRPKASRGRLRPLRLPNRLLRAGGIPRVARRSPGLA